LKSGPARTHTVPPPEWWIHFVARETPSPTHTDRPSPAIRLLSVYVGHGTVLLHDKLGHLTRDLGNVFWLQHHLTVFTAVYGTEAMVRDHYKTDRKNKR